MRVSPVSRFFWHVFLWLPICFGLWYYFGNLMMLPANYLASVVTTSLFPQLVSQMTPHGSVLEVVCAFPPPTPPDMVIPKGQIPELVFNLNVLKYGYSIPLYTALILSSPGTEGVKWFRWIIGVAVIYAAQAWGIHFEVLKTLFFTMGNEIGTIAQKGFSEWQVQGVVLGYQFGYLILPAVTPLALWIGFHRDFLAELIEWKEERAVKDA